MKLASHDAVLGPPPLALVSLLFSFLLGFTPAMASTDSALPYNSRTWQIDEGLPDNMVQAIAQTPDGYLWVGTHNGLARFDGISFTLLDERSMPELKDSSITALCVDRNGALWIGTDGDGLARLAGGTFTRFGKTNGLRATSLTAIYESKDGSLWIGSSDGVSRYVDGKFVKYNQRDGLVSDFVNAVYESEDGSVWIATGEGLNRWKDGILDKYALPNSAPHNSIRAVCQDKQGRLWIGSSSGMVMCDHGKFRTYDTGSGLSDYFISAICEDREGNLWVGTYSGLNCFRGGRFCNEFNNQGGPYDKVNTLFEDREGNLWLGSREGLIRLNPKRILTYTVQQGLTHNNIMSVLEDHNGSIWIGTWGGGLDQLKDEKVTGYSTSNGFPYDLVLSICEGRDGSLWLGADYDGGLIQFKDGKYKRYTGKNGLVTAAIRVIYEDHAGNLWIGTSRGLSCLKDGKFTTYTVKDHLPHDIVRAICEDHAGNIWFGTEKGLSCRKNGQFINFTTKDGLSNDAVLGLYEDEAQNLWIATAIGGLNRYRDGRFTAYTAQQGLFSDEVLEVLEDDHGWLWMSCPRGIFRTRKAGLDAFDQGKIKSISCIAYGKSDGMESVLCNAVGQPAGCKSRDGRLWFPTTKGLIAVVPNVKINGEPPPVFIEELIADKRRITPEAPGCWNIGQDNPSISPHGDSSKIQIRPGRGELEIHYTALSFSTPEKNRFAYKLEGVDHEWIDAGSRRAAYYYNIFPGKYRFHVIACNNDGVWNETGAMLELILLPHFWQTWWFISLVVLAGAGAVGGAVRYISWKKLRQKLALLELQHSLEKDRARIARDIHDDLGATLTQITLLSELTQRESGQPSKVTLHAAQISQTARELVQAMDEIVWAINPRNDSLPRLAGYMIQYAEKLFSGTPLRCRFDTPHDLPEQSLSAETRHHLFLTAKEALNNVARHAAATEVWLRLKVENSELQICIEDNGKGFDLASIRQFRNGLENMKKRMEEIGGTFELSTIPGAGTAIRLRFPLKT